MSDILRGEEKPPEGIQDLISLVKKKLEALDPDDLLTVAKHCFHDKIKHVVKFSVPLLTKQ